MNRTIAPLLLAAVSISAAACTSVPARVADGAAQPAPAHCLRETGSRLPVAAGQCLPVSGRVVLKEDIDHTGAVNVGEALFRLGVI